MLCILETIKNKQKLKFNEYVLEGIPYIGKQNEYLFIYPFSYDDLIKGRASASSVDIFSQLDILMQSAIIKIKNELRLVAEFKLNNKDSNYRQTTPEAPPGYNYLSDGTLVQQKTEPSYQFNNPDNYRPHLMYNPETGEAFLAGTYEMHLEFNNMMRPRQLQHSL